MAEQMLQFEEAESVESKFQRLLDFTDVLVRKQEEVERLRLEELQTLRAEFTEAVGAQTNRHEEEMQSLKEENSKLKSLAAQKQIGQDWELLSTMADVTPVGECVLKQPQDGDGDDDVVQCMYHVERGSLAGLRFTLAHTSGLKEYMYCPVDCPESMQQGSDFDKIFCFPEHMLQKFFHKLIKFNLSD